MVSPQLPPKETDTETCLGSSFVEGDTGGPGGLTACCHGRESQQEA